MVVVIKPRIGDLEASETLDVNLLVRIDENVRYIRIVDEWLDRSKTEGLVQHFLLERRSLGLAKRHLLFRHERRDDLPNLRLENRVINGVQVGKIDPFDHLPVNTGLQIVEDVARTVAAIRLATVVTAVSITAAPIAGSVLARFLLFRLFRFAVLVLESVSE
jgi:hypothetical protein